MASVSFYDLRFSISDETTSTVKTQIYPFPPYLQEATTWPETDRLRQKDQPPDLNHFCLPRVVGFMRRRRRKRKFFHFTNSRLPVLPPSAKPQRRWLKS